MAFEIIHMRPDRNGMYRILAMEDSKLAEENGTNLWHFNILARRWQDPNFVSLNPCITFTVKSDVNLTANFEPVRPSEIEQAAEMLKEIMNQD